MASELIKNYEKIRDYMREFYVYGFKYREDYSSKSARSYDYEKHRIESWLGDYMSFNRTADGKNVFLSIDSRDIVSNPLFQSLRSKSFTSRDISLHFLILDLLHSPHVSLSHKEILEGIDKQLAEMGKSITELCDESTLRKKLKDYEGQGLLCSFKEGKTVKYTRPTEPSLTELYLAIAFFAETSPLGALGSFILKRDEMSQFPLSFKHHYITSALDSDILCQALLAIRERREIVVKSKAKSAKEGQIRVVPIKIFSSAQNGKVHLMAYDLRLQKMVPLRVDYIKSITLGQIYEDYESLCQLFSKMRSHIWGVSMKKDLDDTEYVEFTVEINKGEEYIYNRLIREKRCGFVEMIDENHARFYAYIYDSQEIIPWVRTFITRITSVNFQNKHVCQQFYKDFDSTYKLYFKDEGESV